MKLIHPKGRIIQCYNDGYLKGYNGGYKAGKKDAKDVFKIAIKRMSDE